MLQLDNCVQTEKPAWGMGYLSDEIMSIHGKLRGWQEARLGLPGKS